jgi:hypothetical protein
MGEVFNPANSSTARVLYQALKCVRKRLGNGRSEGLVGLGLNRDCDLAGVGSPYESHVGVSRFTAMPVKADAVFRHGDIKSRTSGLGAGVEKSTQLVGYMWAVRLAPRTR